MMPQRFLRIMPIGLVFFAVTALAEETRVIFPTGVFPDDVVNIQAALDDFGERGVDGVLILKARNEHGIPTPFDFGVDPDPNLRGSVSPRADQTGAIAFRGERNDDARTTLLGGFRPILAERRDKLTVRNIEFRRSFQNAIVVRASTGVVIENNAFLDTEGFTDRIFPLTRVINIATPNVGSPDDLTGKIVVKRNVIDKVNALFSDGIQFFSTNAKSTVSRNDISGVNVAIRATNYRQRLTIRRNRLEAEVTGQDFFAAGIETGCGIGPEAETAIRDNRIFAKDPSAIGFATGISVSGGDLLIDGETVECPLRNSAITGNDIAMADGGSAIEMITIAVSTGRVFDNVITGNTLSGTTIDGIFLDDLDLFGTSPEVDIFDNRLFDNDFEKLQSSSADVFLGVATRDNEMFLDEDDTVIDLGTNNKVVVGDDDNDEDDDGA